jgi:hypothetical protein
MLKNFIKPFRKAIELSIFIIYTRIFYYAYFPWLIYQFSWLVGGSLALLSTLFSEITLLKLYDAGKRDIFLIEIFKKSSSEGSNTFIKILSKFASKTFWVSFLLLSTQLPPLIVILYFRKQSFQFSGLNRREWYLFLFGIIICCTVWTMVLAGGIELIRNFWQSVIKN